jgi:hypothetical protein
VGKGARDERDLGTFLDPVQNEISSNWRARMADCGDMLDHYRKAAQTSEKPVVLHHRLMVVQLTVLAFLASFSPLSVVAIRLHEIRQAQGVVPPLGLVALPIASVLAVLIFSFLSRRISRVWATREGLIVSPPRRLVPWHEVRAMRSLMTGLLGGVWCVEFTGGTRVVFFAHSFASEAFESHRERAVPPGEADVTERERLHGGSMVFVAWVLALVGVLALKALTVRISMALRDGHWGAVAELVAIVIFVAVVVCAVVRMRSVYMTPSGVVVGKEVVPWDQVVELSSWFIGADGPHTLVLRDRAPVCFLAPGDATARFERYRKAILADATVRREGRGGEQDRTSACDPSSPRAQPR